MRILPICFLWLAAVACSSGEKTNPLLEEAASLYEQALSEEEAFQPLLNSLEQQYNRLSVQGRALTSAEQSFLENVSTLQARYAQWREDRIEVPGFGHAHHHHDGHEHEHTHGKKMPEATPEHMLNIQRESLEGVLAMKAEAEALLKP